VTRQRHDWGSTGISNELGNKGPGLAHLDHVRIDAPIRPDLASPAKWWTVKNPLIIVDCALLFVLVAVLCVALMGSAQGADCSRLDLNHDGVVNVQDAMIAVNRHDKALYEEIKQAILEAACPVESSKPSHGGRLSERGMR
jgi:hypothetical protein